MFPLLLAALTVPMTLANDRESEPMSRIIDGNNRLALDLYGTLRDEPGNLFFSPYSISSALAMTYAGAEGETAEQMAEALHFSIPEPGLHEAFDALNAMLTGEDAEGYRLSIANRLWGQRGYDFRPEFLAVTRDRYHAELETVDFASGTEEARRRINAWVEERTEGRIVDLIPSGVLDSLTRLVLTNAIHFKGDWSESFPKSATRDAPFHLTGAEEVEVPLMHRRGPYQYMEADGLKALVLPYGEGDLSMVVLLPDEVDGLADLESKLDADALDRWLSALKRETVDVTLPRFTMSSQFTLNDALKALGMPLAFDRNKADFSGMDGTRLLYLSAAIHKAFVAVDEEGTEAAAATGVVVTTRSAAVAPHPKVFRADHPFLFLIRDTRTGSLLFLGRLTDPRG